MSGDNFVGCGFGEEVVDRDVSLLRGILCGRSRFDANGEGLLFPKEVQQAAVVAADVDDLLALERTEALFAGIDGIAPATVVEVPFAGSYRQLCDRLFRKIPTAIR